MHICLKKYRFQSGLCVCVNQILVLLLNVREKKKKKKLGQEKVIACNDRKHINVNKMKPQ